MIVSLQHRFVLLAMPKCASHALSDAIGTRADMVIRHPPGAKHCNFRKYQRHLRPFLQTFSASPLATICMMREPVSWLESWWRYRQRPALEGHRNATHGLSFDAFVGRYLDGVAPGDTIGRQARFVADRDGAVGVDHLFAYERIGDLAAWISARSGWDLTLERKNVSPEAEGYLTPEMRIRVKTELARDFEIYASL
ncbi:MAG: gamma-glutamyl kinase, partial [Pseudomonadota bacterium]